MAQELRRDQAVRLPNPSAQPFVAALKTCRFFAVVFFWVTMVCVMAYAAAFVATEWVGLYDAPKVDAAKPAAESAPAPAAPGAPAAPTSPVTTPAAPVTTPAAPETTSWLGVFENTASAAPVPPNAKSAPSKDSEDAPTKFFGVPATPAGAAPAKDAPKAVSVEMPKKAAPAASVEALKEAGEALAAAKDAETKGEAVAKPEASAAPVRPTMTPQQKAQYYYDVTINILRPLRVVGVLSSFLLGVTLFLYLQISLLGRLAGIKQLTTALFFLLLFFATVVPWENIFEGFRVNIFYDFTRLMAAHVQRMAGDTGDFWEQAKYFARFLGLPLVSIALLTWSGLQFASGYGESVTANE